MDSIDKIVEYFEKDPRKAVLYGVLVVISVLSGVVGFVYKSANDTQTEIVVRCDAEKDSLRNSVRYMQGQVAFAQSKALEVSEKSNAEKQAMLDVLTGLKRAVSREVIENNNIQKKIQGNEE